MMSRADSDAREGGMLFCIEEEPDCNITDDMEAEMYGGARAKKAAPKARQKPEPKRVLVDGLTKVQDELLRTVQYRTGLLAGRDSLYLATRQYIAESGSASG